MIASQYFHSSDIRADTTGGLDYLSLFLQNSVLGRWLEGLRPGTGLGRRVSRNGSAGCTCRVTSNTSRISWKGLPMLQVQSASSSAAQCNDRGSVVLVLIPDGRGPVDHPLVNRGMVHVAVEQPHALQQSQFVGIDRILTLPPLFDISCFRDGKDAHPHISLSCILKGFCHSSKWNSITGRDRLKYAPYNNLKSGHI